MAVLDETARTEVHTGWMRFLSQFRDSISSLSKADLRAAINAMDDWIEANQGTINAAIPQPARAELTLAQKTVLFCIVALRRVNKEALKSYVGEVD